HREKGRRRSCGCVSSSWKRKSSKGERKEVIHRHPERSRGILVHYFDITSRDSSTALRSAQNDRLARFLPRGRNSNPVDRRSRKSRPGVRRNAAQHRIYGRGPASRPVWIYLGKIDPAGAGGRTIGQMRSCSSGQTSQFYESQRASSFRSCAILQN